MSSRESALGAWADKIPRVDGWSEQPAWDAEKQVVQEAPLTADDVAHDLKQASILLVMGLAALVVAGGFLCLKLDFILHGERTSGTIVDFRSMPRRTYAPVVAYYVDGRRYVVRGSTGSRSSSYDIGDTVPVLYLADDPSEAAIGSFVELYLMPTIFGTIGLVLVGIAVGGGVYVVRKAQRQATAEL